MNSIDLNKQWFGFICGIIGPMIGALVFMMFAMRMEEANVTDYYNVIVKAGVETEIISVATMFNLAIFFMFIWQGMQRAARGVILGTFIYVLLVVLLKGF